MRGPKAIGGNLVPRAQRTPDVEDTHAKVGEFEEVLAEKVSKHPDGKAPSPGRGPATAGRGVGRATTERTAPGGEHRRPQGRLPRPDPGEARELPAREGALREALKGASQETTREPSVERTPRPSREAAGPVPGAPGPPADAPSQVAAPAVTATGHSADVAARVERIAAEIVRAAEVHLHGDGSVEARLELDLGSLGRMHVSLARTAEGRISAALEPTTAEGRRLVSEHLPELARRLEARGLGLQEVKVEASGETVRRVAGDASGPETAEASSLPAAPAAAEPAVREPAGAEAARSQERFDDEQERRGRREPEPPPEEEES
jgi:hypothetical protein